MTDKITWPQFCRAQSANAAYRDAVDLFRMKAFEEAIWLIEEKMAKRQKIIDEWRVQQERKENEKAEKEYRRANAVEYEEEDD